MTSEEEKGLIEIILIVFGFLILPIVALFIAKIRHSRKYWDKENQKIKCGDCGKWEWTMYYSDKGLFRTWKCEKCSSESYMKNQKSKK